MWREAVETFLVAPVEAKRVVASYCIELQGHSPRDIVERLNQLPVLVGGDMLLREVSARLFWGMSKVLDSREALVAAVLGLDECPFAESPIQLQVMLPDGDLKGVLFIENLMSFEKATRSEGATFQGLALVYASGFKASAKRLRSEDGVSLYYARQCLRDTAQRETFEHWLFNDKPDLVVNFWGDLDWAGMRILKTLRSTFQNVNAWEPGYAPMRTYLMEGLGHQPDAADKRGQLPLQNTGCAYADAQLLPLLHGGFVDQELFSLSDSLPNLEPVLLGEMDASRDDHPLDVSESQSGIVVSKPNRSKDDQKGGGMRLCRFEVRNFKCIEYANLEWDNLLVFIGENNAGKSSVLSAIAIFLGGSSIKDASLFRRHQTDVANAIELIGHFDNLTDEEKEQVAVRGRMNGDQWVLKKQYWFEAGEDGEAGSWKEQLYSFSSTEQFIGWPDPDTTWAVFPADYQPLIDALPNRGARPNAASKEALRAAIRQQRPDLIALDAPDWVPNPGGGGNWKSNANSVLPRPILVKAVQEASDETNAKDASTYGKLVNLIVERSLSQRPEMARLQEALDEVLALFRPDDANPGRQAQEVRDLQDQINQSLNEVVGGQALIRTEAPELRTMVLPSTSLVIRDAQAGIETEVGHQGHGLQRTLVITLLQLLVDAQSKAAPGAAPGLQRPTILLIEEPELYLHPQMERLMKDVLHRLAAQAGTQVACCTHSPVFLDIAENYRAIVRMYKTPQGDAAIHQVTQDLFPGVPNQLDKQRLNIVAKFDATVNELFFAKRVVLMEEFSAIAAFEHAARLMGLFERHRRIRREVALVDCNGKSNIPAFQRVLNAFDIPYRVLHDADPGNPAEQTNNQRIFGLLPNGVAQVHLVNPDLEGLLGYAPGKNKPFTAVCTVDNLYTQGQLPVPFQQAVCMAYFGQMTEPQPAP